MAEAWKFDRTGDHLALDFANTVSQRTSAHPIERLAGYGDLIEFARQTEIVTAAEARRLGALAAEDPRKAAAVHRRALELRDALYRVFTDATATRRPGEAELEVVNRAIGRLRLGPQLDWEFSPDPSGLDAPLGPVLLAALALATDPEQRARLRICEAPDCAWLFHDRSKNRSRRWCDMKQCGNRMKARRFHKKHG